MEGFVNGEVPTRPRAASHVGENPGRPASDASQVFLRSAFRDPAHVGDRPTLDDRAGKVNGLVTRIAPIPIFIVAPLAC